MEPWNLGTLEPWNLGTLDSWNLLTFATSNLRTFESLNLRTFEPSNLLTFETLNLRTFKPLNLRTLKEIFSNITGKHQTSAENLFFAVYVDASEMCNTLAFQLGTTSTVTRAWTIKVIKWSRMGQHYKCITT